MLKRLYAILILLSLAFLPLVGQEVEWSIDATVLLNNREGGDGYTPDQTFMFTRLAPEVGVSMNDGQHVLKGGIVWYQPMIDDLSGYKLLPTLYYRYNRSDGWHVTVGLMPRSLMVRRMPRYLWSDSLDYCQPNLHGVMAQLVKPAGYAEIAVDWRQLQTDWRREAFAVMLNNDWRVAGPFRLGGHLQYSHLAKSRLGKENQHVNDDFIINPMAALDLSHQTALDSLRLAAGAIIAMERDRGDEHWRKPAGFVATATARWRWLQLDETFYTGQDLMPLYPALGSLLNLGDPYYHSKTYSRTDLTAHVVSNRFVDLSASLMFHATDRVTGLWQQITCRFYLDNHLWKQEKRTKD
ncbi:MAG: hypothetical protein IKW97_06710 [Muribaculaceae bacterium]|nr:hypothetical protein [Muribaculaceae bacterium]